MSGLTKEEFIKGWEKINARAEYEKFSQRAAIDLQDIYGALDDEDKLIANSVLFEWIISGNEYQKFDALHVINFFKIKDAMPALREVLHSLSINYSPSGQYALYKIEKIIKGLSDI